MREHLSTYKAVTKHGSYSLLCREIWTGLGLDAAVVLGYISSMQDYYQSESIYQSHAQLHQYLGIGRLRIEKALKVLVEAGMLRITVRGGDQARVFTTFPNAIIDYIEKAKEERADKKQGKRKPKQEDVPEVLPEVGFVPVTEEATAPVEEELTDKQKKVLDFNREIVDTLNHEASEKVFQVPGNTCTNRLKSMVKHIDNLCSGTWFRSQKFNTEWLKKNQITDFDFDGDRHTLTEVKELIVGAAKRFLEARNDPKYRFYGNREDTISLDEFLFNQGFSYFLHYCTHKPVVDVELPEWYEEWKAKIKNESWHAIMECFNPRWYSKTEYRKRVVGLVRWFVMARKAGKVNDPGHCIESIATFVEILLEAIGEGIMPVSTHLDNKLMGNLLRYLKFECDITVKK